MNQFPLWGLASRRRYAHACAALAALAAPWVHAADARPGPETFFQNPSMTDAMISPDGKTVAVTLAAAPKERVRLLAIDAQTLKATVLAQYAADDVVNVHWINGHRLVYSTYDLQASAADLTAASGLFAINIDGSYYRQLINKYLTSDYHGIPLHEMLPWYTDYLAPGGDKHDPDEIYVGEPARLDGTGELDLRLHLVNTLTHRIKDIETPIGAEDWVFDADGEPRVTMSLKDDHEKIWLLGADAHWSAIADFNFFEAGDEIHPQFVDDANRLFVTTTHGRDTRSLYTFDIATKTLSDKPFLQSDRYDLDPTFVKRGGKPVGIRYTIDAEVTKWLDPAIAALQAKIDELLPTTVNRLSVAEKGDGRFSVVFAYSDREPGLYFLYDAQQGKLTALGKRHPEVDADRMSGMEPVHYAARDGLQIPAWLTVPQGAQRKNLPLVVLVHGGPYVRGEDWHWNPEVQFLAARGYAVLEPEYRGSMGYGTKLFKAGWKQWGLGMQNDVADGVKWAVDQGLVDPARVCIAGAGYGGYAALMGLINDPKVYRCGIDRVGITDIDLLYTPKWSDLSYNAEWSNLASVWKDYGMPRLVGDPVIDAAQIKATSPLRNVDKIHAPLLLAYGGKDRSVPKSHGELFRDALMKQPGADVQWVLYGDEGSRWRSIDTRIDYWNRVSAFLDKNLGKP